MKIFILGARPFQGVPAGAWFDDQLPNLADYDVVIVSTASLRENFMALAGRSRAAWDDDDAMTSVRKVADNWKKRLEWIEERLARVLGTGGMVVAILGSHPVVAFRNPNFRDIPNFLRGETWLPLPIEPIAESGDTLSVQDQSLSRYFELVRRWPCVFTVKESVTGSILNELQSTKVSVRVETLASDRQGNPIAARYLAFSGDRVSGPFVVLTPPTERSEEEAIATLLEDQFGVVTSIPEPPWLDDIIAPGEPSARAAYRAALSELEAAHEAVSSAASKLEELRAPLRVIFQQHYELQDAVADVFRRIGFEIHESPVSDEFIIGLDERRILVEVKGSAKSASQKHLSQLAKDVDIYFGREGAAIKGVLVSNAWINLHPNERESPNNAVFPANVVEFAELKRLALLDTRALLRAYERVLGGLATPSEMFNLIMGSEGVVAVPE